MYTGFLMFTINIKIEKNIISFSVSSEVKTKSAAS